MHRFGGFQSGKTFLIDDCNSSPSSSTSAAAGTCHSSTIAAIDW
jgi:hypothetical protein